MRRAILGGILLLALTLGSASSAFAAREKAGPEKMLTATGTISKLQATQRMLFVAVPGAPPMRFVWTADTKINGTLSQGAKVTIRYTNLPDGQNLAHQISVGH